MEVDGDLDMVSIYLSLYYRYTIVIYHGSVGAYTVDGGKCSAKF